MSSKFQAIGRKHLQGSPQKIGEMVNVGSRSGDKYLRKGTHDVVIEAVDVSQVDNNRLGLVFRAAAGKAQHNERSMFLLNKDQDDYSYGFKNMMAALFQSADGLATFIELISANHLNLDVLRGMRLKITLGYHGEGYELAKSPAGHWTAVNAKTGTQLDGIEAPTVEAARKAAESNGYKKAWLNIIGVDAVNPELNVSALQSAVKMQSQPRPHVVV